MAWSMQQRNVPMKANSDFSSSQFLIAEIVNTGVINTVDVGQGGGLTAAYDRGYGVVQNHPKAGEYATICVEGESRVVAGAAVSIGDFITANSLGFAISVVSGAARDANRTSIIGRALSAAASGSVFTAAIDVFQTKISSGAAWQNA